MQGALGTLTGSGCVAATGLATIIVDQVFESSMLETAAVGLLGGGIVMVQFSVAAMMAGAAMVGNDFEEDPELTKKSMKVGIYASIGLAFFLAHAGATHAEPISRPAPPLSHVDVGHPSLLQA